MPFFLISTLVSLVVLAAMKQKATAAAKAALPASGGPTVNPNTKLVVFDRFTDLDLAANDTVQLMGANGAAYVVNVTGAKSETYGAAFQGTPVGTTSGSAPIVFQSQDVAAVAPVGTSPTATEGWAMRSTELPAALQSYGVTDASSISVGSYVRLQDTRGSGTGIVVEVTAIDPSTGAMTGTVTRYQGAIVPMPTQEFAAANVAYVAADDTGTPPPGASIGNYAPLGNPAFQKATSGFTCDDLAVGDIVTLTGTDGASYVAAISSWGPGGVTAQETTGPAPGSALLFDCSEIQTVATAAAPTVFFPTPAALHHSSGTTPAAASAGCAPVDSGALFSEQIPFAGAAPIGGGMTPAQIQAFKLAFLKDQASKDVRKATPAHHGHPHAAGAPPFGAAIPRHHAQNTHR